MKWIFVILIFSSAAYAQRTIEGKIIDADTKKPVSFASVLIVGTTKGTSSNLDGQFTLTVSGEVSLKITSIGYESLEISTSSDLPLIQLKPIAIRLNEVIVFNKAIDAKKIVRKSFANIPNNYDVNPFLEKFFYRHYCKDDSTYGRLVEAFVDVMKNEGHRAQSDKSDVDQLRVTQIRRSLDKTIMAQGHEPISMKSILHADIVGYQTPTKSEHLSFFSDVSNLKTDFQDYTFTFEGATLYDGQEVYKINYAYKKDSVQLTSGKYRKLTQVSGSVFVSMDKLAFVKTEEVKKFGNNTVRTSAYYRKINDRYYPYLLGKEGETHLTDSSTHSFRIDLMSVEVETNSQEKFVGQELSQQELLNIPYDYMFWSNNTILKTTPLEEKIIRDLGEGTSLNKQFELYRQYEVNTHEGGRNGNQKFEWFKEFNKNKRGLYLLFWSGDFKSYLLEMELAKQVQKKYRNETTVVLLSLEEDEMKWQQTVSKYGLFADGIINYRIGKNAEMLKSFDVRETPAFILISKSGSYTKAKKPSDSGLAEEIKNSLKN
jgi:hypothetical protein